MEDWRPKAILHLKSAGQTIIDNAETMIGGYDKQTGDIDICISLSYSSVPVITVTQRLVPDHIEGKY